MDIDAGSLFRRACRIAAAGALALGLAACDQRPPAWNIDKGFESAAGRATEPPADAPPPGIDLASNAAGDDALAARVKAAISAEPALKSLAVDVNAADGVVTLFGTADSPATSHQAAMVALDVDGVRSVKNEMVIGNGS